MIWLAFLGGIILGAGAMAIYNLAHGSQVHKLSADLMAELAKVKSAVGIK